MRFRVPNERQAELCRACGIEPDGMAVTIENDRYICLLHHKSRNEITIYKSERQKRIEKERGMWRGN